VRVAIAAAFFAAVVLGLAVSGVVGQVPADPKSDTISLRSVASASPSPSLTTAGEPEKVPKHVEEEPWDDKGGRRRDAERAAEDSSGSGSAEEQAPAPAASSTEREDNSGRGSRNSGSGSENSGSGSIDSDLRVDDD
jgi:type IV secretory pathway VirB10-like protein